ncbi:FtsW/RodA/SpoVE family cell cycle protein [Candidatus Contubernalis alkaliaceticus]|uniref:FtsW/RodA/SpoVE family cell cycle protein n=1 Tax=Candidatus Contubernalis alkaliaceticus TaxID=338645 RepID=UPI001F4BCEBB|nr:FtsW/RodA/SpoVE family cell cycle protein [Candidatus Contubernalis alkalaceticus]UNC91053.1 FtsW/RodA/SpoVE family cell cycle protein [Candidatus Contubernalis alkalaceticus]
MTDILEIAQQLLDMLLAKFADMFVSVGNFPELSKWAAELYTLVVRWVFPILALTIFLRCILPLLHNGKGNKVWGYLCMRDGTREPVKNWENLMGRSKFCDIVINLPFVSRSHAVLTFYNGIWSIADLGSKGGVEVNEIKVESSQVVNYGDTISLSGVEMVLDSADREQKGLSHQNDTSRFADSGRHISTGMTLFLILIFQLLGGMQVYFSMGPEASQALPLVFLIFILTMCFHYLIMRWFSQKKFELELLCYFLCGFNLLIVASADPNSLNKQLVAILIGIAVYTLIMVLIGNLGLAHKLKYFLMAMALVLMTLNLAIGDTYFGAKRWINLGFVSFQPMEFVKIAFVMAGTATLDKLLTTRNMTAFIAFSAACIGTLVLIRDFGTAVVIFGTFIVIAFMQSGDLRTIALITAGAIFASTAVVSFMPYIASRFATWGNVWELANTTGYQQTRTMIASASGGLLGVGGGNGFFKNIPAADTDLVFGLLSEEWGLLIALIVVLTIVFLAIYTVFLTKNCRSSFYAIAACGAASIFLIQTALNVLGSVDILPLTGITIPFVSNGGSSMIASWGLLAFIKSADDRIRLDKDNY